MNLHILIILIYFLVLEIKGEDFCITDTFKPICSKSEIILIQKAIFGRMNFGRCLSENEFSSKLGLKQTSETFRCQVDVIDIIHKKCSFRNECVIPIIDADLDKQNPCAAGLKSYLDVEYICLSVIREDLPNCIISILNNEKYLTTFNWLPDYVSLCGKHSKPWIIDTSRGQIIKLSVKTIDHMDVNKKICDFLIGFIIEETKNEKINTSICNDGNFIVYSSQTRNNMNKNKNIIIQRNKTFYLSKEYKIKVYLLQDTIKKENKKFLFKIEAEGCSDMIPLEDAWLKRNNDDIVIGCYTNKQTWHLRCVNKIWSGVLGNCSDSILMIIAISGFAFIICLIIIFIGLVMIKRYYSFIPKYLNNAYYLEKKNTHIINNHDQNISSEQHNNLSTNASSDQILLTYANHINDEKYDDKYFVLEKEDANI